MKRIYIILFTAAFALLLHSCSKDFIVQNPADAINQGDALTSEAALTAALNGVYAQLRSVSLYGRDLPVIGDLQADNTFVESKNSGRYLNQFKYTVTLVDGVPSEIWSAAYTAILRANQPDNRCRCNRR